MEPAIIAATGGDPGLALASHSVYWPRCAQFPASESASSGQRPSGRCCGPRATGGQWQCFRPGDGLRERRGPRCRRTSWSGETAFWQGVLDLCGTGRLCASADKRHRETCPLSISKAVRSTLTRDADTVLQITGRHPTSLGGSHLTPIPIGEAIASLSAILLSWSQCGHTVAGNPRYLIDFAMWNPTG